MPYTLTIATPATRALVVEALRGAADQRTRVAKGAARKVAGARAEGRDVRSQAVKVTALLAEADELSELAAELEAAAEVVVLSVAQDGALEVIPIPEPVEPLLEDPDEDEDPDDDGLSPAAHAAAERAGLTAVAVDEDAPDVDTGADPEDDPADTDVEEALKP